MNASFVLLVILALTSAGIAGTSTGTIGDCDSLYRSTYDKLLISKNDIRNIKTQESYIQFKTSTKDYVYLAARNIDYCEALAIEGKLDTKKIDWYKLSEIVLRLRSTDEALSKKSTYVWEKLLRRDESALSRVKRSRK